MTDFRRLEERYERDAAFHQMVKVLYNQIEQLNFSPQEVREAALYAAFKFEMLHSKPIMIPFGVVP